MKTKRTRPGAPLSGSRKRLILLVCLIGLGVIIFMAIPSRGRQVVHAVPVPYGVGDPQFRRALGVLFGWPLVEGNRITPLQNGDEIFPAMLAAINGATQSVTFECAYFRKGTLARQFALALAARARAGVKVHAILDWAGASKLDREDWDIMRAGGVELEVYHKPHLYAPRRSYDRSHRRVLVVDGRIGFTGGACISDEWLGHAQDKDHWRDTQFRLDGPVVAQLQAAFMDNWREMRGTVLHEARYFPPLAPAGAQAAQIVTSSPDEGSENVRLTYLLAIGAARRSIQVQNPYFVPDNVMRDALLNARKRGVAVSILLPHDSVTDAKFTTHASRSRWGPLLEAGVRLYRYRVTLLHMKIMIVDSAFVTAGSANFDNRSFRLNDEVNFASPDTALALQLAGYWERDREHSSEYTLADWHKRSLWQKVMERVAATFRAQL